MSLCKVWIQAYIWPLLVQSIHIILVKMKAISDDWDKPLYNILYCIYRYMDYLGGCLWPMKSMWALSEIKWLDPFEKCYSGVKSRSQHSGNRLSPRNYLIWTLRTSHLAWYKLQSMTYLYLMCPWSREWDRDKVHSLRTHMYLMCVWSWKWHR